MKKNIKSAIRNNTSLAAVENYETLFLQTNNQYSRGEKSIYIRLEYHQRLTRIAQVIGGDKIPLYAYLDNILEHHFNHFENIITEEYNKKQKPIF